MGQDFHLIAVPLGLTEEVVVDFPLAARAVSAMREEHGVTIVVSALWILVILGFGAFAIDTSRIYTERAELQSAADAAALAIAADCVSDCILLYDEYGVADTYADANASDRASGVEDVTIDHLTNTVEVTTATEDESGGTVLNTVLAQVLGYDGMTVRAEASAQWGSPGGGYSFPLIFSKCEWDNFGSPGFVDAGLGLGLGVDGFLHRSSAVLDGELPPASGYAYAEAFVTIYFHGNSVCHAGPSGQDLPGGFGWLETNAGACLAKTGAGKWSKIDPGTSPANGCVPADLQERLGTVMMVPYYDQHRGTGNNAEYSVYGYGALYVTGYYFGGQYRVKSLIDGKYPCKGNERCIQGYMIGEWTDVATEIGGPDLGVSVLQLTG